MRCLHAVHSSFRYCPVPDMNHVKSDQHVQSSMGSDSKCIDMPIITNAGKHTRDGTHRLSGAASECAESTAVATGQLLLPITMPSSTRLCSMDDPRGWNFFDERMKNLRRLLQLTFLSDMFTQKQAELNKRLGLVKYCHLFSDDPRTCVGFGTLLRWTLYIMCVCTIAAVCSGVLFILPRGEKGDPDYTQLPMKLAFLFFGIEVGTTMLFFSRAATDFASRHISRGTVRNMSTVILIFSIILFWLSYSVVFFSFIFFSSGHLKDNALRSKDFSSDMYRMHKVWTGGWIDQPVFLFFYSAAMFVAFSVYIVSVRCFVHLDTRYTMCFVVAHIHCCFLLISQFTFIRTLFSRSLFGAFGCRLVSCSAAWKETPANSKRCLSKAYHCF